MRKSETNEHIAKHGKVFENEFSSFFSVCLLKSHPESELTRHAETRKMDSG